MLDLRQTSEGVYNSVRFEGYGGPRMLCGRICEVLRRGLVVAVLCAGCLLPARAWADVVPSLGSQADDQDVAVGSIEVEIGANHDLIDPVSVEMNANERRASMPKNYFPFSFNGTLYQSRAYEMLALVNRERASKGIAPLKWDADLESSAVTRAAETSIMFSHLRPNGSDCFTAFPDGLYAEGENIAMGFSSAQDTFNQWKNSSGHYANMMSPSFTRIGISCFYGGAYGWCWVQTFGARSGSVNETPSHMNGDTSVPIVLPDSIIRSATWTANTLTPGVGSMRVLPSVTVQFEGVLNDGFQQVSLGGDVSYGYEMFSWSTDNERVAAFLQDQGSAYAVGVSEGSTSYVAKFATTSRLDKKIPVTVTKIGAFTDVVVPKTDHWESIFWLSGSGVTAGYNDGSFRPYAQVARCDMAAFLRRLARGMSVSDAATWKPSASDWKRFSDVTRITPHAEDVLWLVHAGISTGFPNGTFAPYANVARCDMAAFLRRLAKLSPSSDAGTWTPAEADWLAFNDVSIKTDHAEDILWLRHAEITLGYPGNLYKPLGKVARCDMAAFLERLSAELS